MCFENFWKIPGRALMEFLFKKLQAYQLLTSAFCVLENFWDKVFSGVPFYRNKRYSLSSQIAAKDFFLKNFQAGTQLYLKRTPHGYFTGKFPNFLLHCFLRTNFIKTTRLKLIKKKLERIKNKTESGEFRNK